MQRCVRYSLATAIVLTTVLAVRLQALPPNPIVSSIFVPIEGDIIEPGTTNPLHLTGEIHVLTQVSVSDTNVPSVGIWANLVRVRGTSTATVITYLGVGARRAGRLPAAPCPAAGRGLTIGLACQPGHMRRLFA